MTHSSLTQHPYPDPPPHGKGAVKSNWVLRVIGIFKLLKAAGLLVVAAVTLRLAHGDVAENMQRLVDHIRADPNNHYLHEVLSRLLGVSARRLHELAVGTIIYAGLFVVEGVGLLLAKRWAEYFTIVMTGLLIPLEVYELWRRVTPPRVIFLVLNVAIVVYLIWQVRRGKGGRTGE